MKKNLFLTIISFIVSLAGYTKITTNEVLDSLIPHKQELGIWRTISFDATNTPTNGGYYVFTIDVPPEGVIPGTNLMGPSKAFLFNHLGNKVDIYVHQKMFLIEASLTPELSFDMPVNKWVHSTGNYCTDMFCANNSPESRCYYFIEFKVYNLPEGL